MNGLVRQRARLARVRKIQHGLAATVAAQAAGRVQMLETSRERLRQMRGGLRPVEGPTTGAAMARMGELAMRLDSARHNLGPTIDSARSAAAARCPVIVLPRGVRAPLEELLAEQVGAPA